MTNLPQYRPPKKKVYQRKRIRARKSIVDRVASFVYLVGVSISDVVKDEFRMFSNTFLSKKNKSVRETYVQDKEVSKPKLEQTKPPTKHLDISAKDTQNEYIEKQVKVEPKPSERIIHTPNQVKRDNFLDLKQVSQEIDDDFKQDTSVPTQTESNKETVPLIPVSKISKNIINKGYSVGKSGVGKISDSFVWLSKASSLLLAKQGVSTYSALSRTSDRFKQKYPRLFKKYSLFDISYNKESKKEAHNNLSPSVDHQSNQFTRQKDAENQHTNMVTTKHDSGEPKSSLHAQLNKKRSLKLPSLFTTLVGTLRGYWVQLWNRTGNVASVSQQSSFDTETRGEIDTSNNDTQDELGTMALLKRKIKKRLPKNVKNIIPKGPKSGFWSWVHRLIIIGLIGGFILLGVFFIWVATLEIPDSNIDDLIVAQSTKIYDSTGEVLLYDVFEDERRTVVGIDEISNNMQQAILATEDDEFYSHGGYDIKAIVRSICHEVSSRIGFGDFFGSCPKGGGSTITQQVIKNTLLNNEHSYKRKVKEVVLASRLEDQKTKDEILEIYLNEIAFGGPVYGVEQASQSFFGISASELSIAQSAFLSALPKAPTTYRNDFEKWEGRAKYIMGRMFNLGMISQSEYKDALEEEIDFVERVDEGIKAPHFVFYVQEKLEEQIIEGEQDLNFNGYNIRTTLNWKLQEGLEEVVSQHVERLAGHNASNMAIVAIENKTGKVIGMVGSKDYFAEDIDGKFNIATAERQPGSTFKPFVYASALAQGYTPETILWDTQTEFSTSCYPDGQAQLPQYSDRCYMPQNFDKRFRGPISMRSALAQSLNIPAVKALYLVGVRNAMNFASKMGISTLDRSPSFYGLNLVLGGGEVKLIEMAGAYSVFGNDGIRHRLAVWEEITDAEGKNIDEYEDKKEQAIPSNTARMINGILSDNNAKRPMFGQNSRLYYESVPVAVKTGTTNNFRDMWTIGYTPEVTIGVWAGNNDNTPMASRPSSSVVGPVWRDAMDKAIALYKPSVFKSYSAPDPETLKPMLRGDYEGGEIRYVDPETGEEVEEPTEEELAAGLYVPQGTVEYHSILYSAAKGSNPQTSGGGQGDGLYEHFEYGVQNWVEAQGWATSYATSTVEGLLDQIQAEQNNNNSTNEGGQSSEDAELDFQIIAPISGDVVDGDDRYKVEIVISGNDREIETIYYYLNNTYLGAGSHKTTTMRMTPNKTRGVKKENEVRVVVETSDGRRIEKTSILIIR